MSKVIRFNTQRLYQKEGQIIRVQKLDDGRFVFIDESRGVDGIVDAHHNDHLLKTDGDVIRHVMHAYDHLNYGHGKAGEHELIWALRKEKDVPEPTVYRL